MNFLFLPNLNMTILKQKLHIFDIMRIHQQRTAILQVTTPKPNQYKNREYKLHIILSNLFIKINSRFKQN